MLKMVLCKSDGLNERFREEALKREISLTVCTTQGRAVEAVSRIHPDVLLFDIAINGGDGIELYNICKGKFARGICLTSVINDFSVALCNQYGVDYIMSDLMPLNVILDRIYQIVEGNMDYVQPIDYSVDQDDINKRIMALLSNIGIKHARLGFKYSCEVLSRMADGCDTVPLCSIYRDIAIKYGTKANCVERSIRSAVEEAWTNGSLVTILDMFGYSVKADKGKPTNKEFLYGLYQKLVL